MLSIRSSSSYGDSDVDDLTNCSDFSYQAARQFMSEAKTSSDQTHNNWISCKTYDDVLNNENPKSRLSAMCSISCLLLTALTTFTCREFAVSTFT